jgi:hypothetical protein
LAAILSLKVMQHIPEVDHWWMCGLLGVGRLAPI